MTNKIIAVIATLALVVALGVAIFGTKTVHTNTTQIVGGTTNFDALTLDNGDLTMTNGTGAGAGTSTPSVITQNGMAYTSYRASSFLQSTTTLCAFQSPAATSTLVFGSVQITAATNTNLFVDLGQAASAFTTTTQIGTTYSWSDSFTAGTVHDDLNGTIIASTSPSAANNASNIFPPSQWFVAKVASKNNDGASTHAGFSLTGTCEARFVTN